MESSPRRIVSCALAVPIDVVSFEGAQDRIMEWARANASRYVVLANAHVVVTASRDKAFGNAVRQADMAAPDGAPVAWMLRALGHKGQQRVCGPDLMWALLGRCAQEGVNVFFYGSTRDTLDKLVSRVLKTFPGIKVVGTHAPPFRELTADEAAATLDILNFHPAGLIFVGLGCPKQEQWMLLHRSKLNGVMLGVGAAFDFHAGNLTRAPSWMRDSGLEWLHRLVSEPRRLGRRYFLTNTLFIAGAFKQLWTRTFRRS